MAPKEKQKKLHSFNVQFALVNKTNIISSMCFRVPITRSELFTVRY